MRLLFEGPSIETVLARVRDEHGPGAHIVAADKVRSGGIAGFFARERYVISVQVDSSGDDVLEPPEAPERAVDAPGTLLELADAIDAAEAADERVVMSTAGMPGSAGAVDTLSSAMASNARLAVVNPVLSTESPIFAAVLAGWASAADATPFPADWVSGTAPVPVPAVWASAAEPASVPLVPLVPTVHAPEREFVPATLTRITAAPHRVQGDLDCRLLALGLPREIVVRVGQSTPGSLRERLADAFAELLPALPSLDLQPGDVHVIAGAGRPTFDLARAVAKQLRLDPNEVLLAAPTTLGTGVHPASRLSGPAEARRRSARMQRADVATIVAVDAPCDGESAVWARNVADALGARTMWALVEATSKPADIADHLGGLGRLDGIAVHATGATRDPATVLRPVLDLGLPTVLLEGHVGNAQAWANLIAERVGDS
jgi:hypothetical protein